MAKPASLPIWATGGGAQVVEPLLAKKQLGWEPDEQPPAEWFNWWMLLVYSWVVWVNGFEAENIVWTGTHTFQNDATFNDPVTFTDDVETGAASTFTFEGPSVFNNDITFSPGIAMEFGTAPLFDNGFTVIGEMDNSGGAYFTDALEFMDEIELSGAPSVGRIRWSHADVGVEIVGQTSTLMLLVNATWNQGLAQYDRITSGQDAFALEITNGDSAPDPTYGFGILFSPAGDGDTNLVFRKSRSDSGIGGVGASTGIITHATYETPGLINSWANIGGAALLFWKDAAGGVQFRGGVSGGASGTSCCVLPAAYRPVADRVIHGWSISANASFKVIVKTNGNVELYGTGNCYLDGCRFE